MTTSDRPVVLIVDDEETLTEFYAELLSPDYNVRTAFDGETALDQLDAKVDVVLLDRRMPDLSGDVVLDDILDRDLDCRVAMVTAVEPDFDIVDMGFDDYLVKPVSGEELRTVVDRLVTRHTYAELLQQTFSLAAKKAVLDTHKSRKELERSEEYADLERRLADLYDRLDRTIESFDRHDVRALYRDIERETPHTTDLMEVNRESDRSE